MFCIRCLQSSFLRTCCRILLNAIWGRDPITMSLHEYQLRLLSITTVAQSILQEFLVNASEELLAQSPQSAQPNISALSTILKEYFRNFHTELWHGLVRGELIKWCYNGSFFLANTLNLHLLPALICYTLKSVSHLCSVRQTRSYKELIHN